MVRVFEDTHEAAAEVWSRLGTTAHIATPLGLGKPNVLLNAIYNQAKKNPTLRLNIYTALSLNPPKGSSDLARRFLKPFVERQRGKSYPDLDYAADAESNSLPKNIRIHEFYLRAGSSLKSESLQQDYQSINYTRVAEAVYQSRVQAVVQLISEKQVDGKSRYSLSCNPDVTLDLVDLYKAGNKPFLKVGVIHSDLPFLAGDAEVDENFFDIIIRDPKTTHQLFALPRMPISAADHAIGFYASQLVADDGTLQIGIGSLSEAVVGALLLRHQNNHDYQELVRFCWKEKSRERLPLQHSSFTSGIYGLSEMVTDAYMHLRRAGILNRYVTDEKSGAKTYLHGAFFLGSKAFYAWLRSLTGEDFNGIRMTRVSKVNDLYDPNELLFRRQRRNARFLNTCMQVTLLGGAASETLEDGRVVSGVGGQYNFVAMSEELKGARSILMLRSFRMHEGNPLSNIVWSHGHLTIPRHLRDIVVTEYGIADLRNKTDEECIRSLIEIADCRFQKQLIAIAQKNGKLTRNYRLPLWALQNTPKHLQLLIAEGRMKKIFNPFPLGSDFTSEERKIALALELIQERVSSKKIFDRIKMVLWGFSGTNIEADHFDQELRRMDLLRPKKLKEKFFRALLLKALSEVNFLMSTDQKKFGP